jgi:hypothetical protein
MESESKHATRATVHENALKEFRKDYAIPLAVADNQKAEIGRFLEVVRVCTHDPKLDDPMPTIKWAILFKNRSVHRISLDREVGPLFFEGHKLTEHKDILENKVVGLYPDREGSILFEQRLSTPEVNLLKSLPAGKFEFDKVKLYAKRSSADAEHVPPDRVVIFSRFRATLGRCSDEKSQAVEELEAEMARLRTERDQFQSELQKVAKARPTLKFEIDAKQSQVGSAGVSKDSTKIQANVRLRCLKISDSKQAVREFSAALFKIADGDDLVVLERQDSLVVMQEPTMDIIKVESGWTVDEPLTAFRWYRFIFDMRDELRQAILDNPRDYFFRVKMDVIGQDLEYEDFFVESWSRAVTSNSYVILRRN